jgi:hypothetical protein
MKAKIRFSGGFCNGRTAGLMASAVLFCILLMSRGAAPGPGRPGPPGVGPGRPAERPGGGSVERFNHGSVRHEEAHAFRPTPEIHHGPEVRPGPAPRPGGPPVRTIERREGFVHHDVDVDMHRRHFWNNFVFGRRLAALPAGFLSLQIGGAPYYYNGGIYYQPVDGGYQEVYPPVGASIPSLPDGSVEVAAGGQMYYYAGGAFYVQQADGTYAIAPTPIGVTVPELPPGVVEVSVNGKVAYQFNGIYYQPVFSNGVTQYETFRP